MMNGAILEIDVILTGFLEEALEELSKMVIIATSSAGTKEQESSHTEFPYYPSGVGHLTSKDGNQ